MFKFFINIIHKRHQYLETKKNILNKKIPDPFKLNEEVYDEIKKKPGVSSELFIYLFPRRFLKLIFWQVS